MMVVIVILPFSMCFFPVPFLAVGHTLRPEVVCTEEETGNLENVSNNAWFYHFEFLTVLYGLELCTATRSRFVL